MNIFAFLSATLLDTSITSGGPGGTQSPPKHLLDLWQSLGFAATGAIFSPVAYFFIDTKGRRWLLLTSLLLMFPLLLATGFSFLSSSIAVREVFLILYYAAYCPGAGAVPYLYASEIFPLPNREVGMSMVCSLGYLLAGLLGLTVPHLIQHLGRTRLLALFSLVFPKSIDKTWLTKIQGSRSHHSYLRMAYRAWDRRKHDIRENKLCFWGPDQATHSVSDQDRLALLRQALLAQGRK